jgi:hypothetical protein
MILRSDPADPADWTVVAVGEAVLAVSERARADDLAARLAGPDGFRAALERLVSGGIAAAPDFALLDGSGGLVRVVLRGPAEVVAGSERISGAGVTTWTERVLEQAGELRLTVPGSAWTIAAAAPVETTPAAPATRPTAVAEAAPDPVPAPVREDAAPHATLAPPVADDEAPTPDGVLAPADADAETDADVETDVDADPAEPYAFLFGDTVYRTIGGADVRIPNPDPDRPGDHDGRTVLVDELEAHEQGELPEAPAPAVPTMVLELPSGVVEPLDAPLLVGRSPSDPGHDASGGPPRLVRIAADDKDISRTHARIEVAGGAVVVTDLESKNGTSVTMPGSAPLKLRGGEPAVVLPGTLLDLGGGVVMTVRESVGGRA